MTTAEELTLVIDAESAWRYGIRYNPTQTRRLSNRGIATDHIARGALDFHLPDGGPWTIVGAGAWSPSANQPPEQDQIRIGWDTSGTFYLMDDLMPERPSPRSVSRSHQDWKKP